MPSLKTNFIRTQINSECFRYEIEIIANQNVDPKFYHEIQGYFIAIDELIVFSYPYVYSVNEINLKNFNFMLSNGQKLQILICSSILTLNSKQIAVDIHRQIMKNTNFLYNSDLELCFNPFDQKNVDQKTSLMPGLKIHTQMINGVVGFYLIPLQAKIKEFKSLSNLDQKASILDHNSGNFYKKSSIVRYDKINQQIHFRTGQIISMNHLKSIEISQLNGFQLASRLNNYFQRIKKSQKLARLIQKWQIKFDSRFLEVPCNFFPVCHILCRNNQDKSLGEVLSSISNYNYQYNFRKFAGSVTYDDSIRSHIYFLVPQISAQQVLKDKQIQLIAQSALQQQQIIMPIIAQFQGLKQRMSLQQCKITLYRYNLYPSLHNGYKQTLTEIDQFIAKQKLKDNIEKIFILNNYQNVVQEETGIRYQHITKAKRLQTNIDEKKLYHKIIQHFLTTGVYFHLLDFVRNQFLNCQDIMAFKILSNIYTKLRLNPWKIKDIPFGTKPLMAFSLYVKNLPNNIVSISVIGTLNAFLSKYTSVFTKCKSQQVQLTISNLIRQCIQKFKSIHNIAPVRAMIFRRGDRMDNIQNELKVLQSRLLAYNCKPTLIVIQSQSTPLCIYNQIDTNYISKDTVKPTQLLCQLKYNDERFLQFQMDQPLHKISIFGLDQQDPYFQEKVIELSTKIIFTYSLMEMRFGKGLGFVQYAEKLYQFDKNYQIQTYRDKLKQGLLMFL